MTLALRFNWTEAQVDATDPDLIEELLTFVAAEGDEKEAERRRAERKRR